MGLYEDLSSTDESVQVLLVCLMVFSSVTPLFLWERAYVIHPSAILTKFEHAAKSSPALRQRG